MTDSIFLDFGDMERLTGTKVKRLQIEHLLKIKIPFQLDRNGAPLVLKGSLYSLSKLHHQPKRKQSSIIYSSLNA